MNNPLRHLADICMCVVGLALIGEGRHGDFLARLALTAVGLVLIRLGARHVAPR